MSKHLIPGRRKKLLHKAQTARVTTALQLMCSPESNTCRRTTVLSLGDILTAFPGKNQTQHPLTWFPAFPYTKCSL